MKNFTYNKKLAYLTLAMMAAAVFAMRSHAEETTPAAESRAVAHAELCFNASAGAYLPCRPLRRSTDQIFGYADDPDALGHVAG